MNCITKKVMIITLMTVMLLAPALTISQAIATTVEPPNWDVSGYWHFNVNSNLYPGGNPYPKEMTISQDLSGVITGSGKNLDSSGYEWAVAGQVNGNSIILILTYTSPGMVGYVATLTGTISPTGQMTGEWDDVWDDYGCWMSTCGAAVSTHIKLTLSDGSELAASIQILTGNNLPPCIPKLPDGITPYINVEIVGTFNGIVTVRVSYVDEWDDKEIEENFRLYMADCVDFNLDGTINGKDLALIKEAIKNDVYPEPSYMGVSFDVDNDNDIDEVDVDIVKDYMTKGLIENKGRGSASQARLPWLDITTWVDTDNNFIYGETDHFSIFRGR